MSCFPLSFKNSRSQYLSFYKTFNQSDCFDEKTKNELANESNFVKIQYFQEIVKPCSDNTILKSTILIELVKYCKRSNYRTKLDQKARWLTRINKIFVVFSPGAEVLIDCEGTWIEKKSIRIQKRLQIEREWIFYHIFIFKLYILLKDSS